MATGKGRGAGPCPRCGGSCGRWENSKTTTDSEGRGMKTGVKNIQKAHPPPKNESIME